MGQQKQPRLDWNERDDGSVWAPVELNTARGLIAVTPGSDDAATSTAVFEVPIQSTELDEATRAVESWLIEIGAK